MLRPATPLTLLYLVSFVLLLLSTISAPIVKAIPLGAYNNCTFGVFGYCQPGSCSSVSIAYDTSMSNPSALQYPRLTALLGVCNSSADGAYDFGASTRHSLSSILIVHPIAAFINLVCVLLAGAAHFHGPSHSPKYLLGLLILSFPTLLITLLAFLVDILLFVPHLQWGGWIVLGSAIICMITSILICAMRRTLVSRKARKKRIAENAEMSGADFYARQAQVQMVKDTPTATVAPASDSGFARAESPPPVGGTTNEKLPHFATFNGQPRREDDRQPLNPGRDPSLKTNSTNPPRSQGSNSGRRPPDVMTGVNRSRSGDGRVSPVSPAEYDGQGYVAQPPGDRHYGGRSSSETRRPHQPPMYGRGGRGGYPPPRNAGSRGGYGPGARGPPMPRGGYAPRGGYPPRGGPGGMRAPPPQGYGHHAPWGAAAAGAGVGMAAGAMAGRNYRNHQQGPPGYNNNPYPPNDPYPPQNRYDEYPPQPQYGAYNPSQQELQQPPPQPQPEQPQFNDTAVPYRGPASPLNSRRPSNSSMRNNSNLPPSTSDAPPVPQVRQDLPIGAAVEMDASSGSPARSPNPNADAFPSRTEVSSPVISPLTVPQTANTTTSSFPLPEHLQTQPGAAPVELPGHAVNRHRSPSISAAGSRSGSRSGRKSTESTGYYEDVQPRFAQDEIAPPLPTQSPPPAAAAAINPPILTSGGHLRPSVADPGRGISASSTYTNDPARGSGDRVPSSDDPLGPLDRARSPGAESSVSQRGINPNWSGVPPPLNVSHAAPAHGPLPPRPGMAHRNIMGSGSSHYSDRRKLEDPITANPEFSVGPSASGGAGGAYAIADGHRTAI